MYQSQSTDALNEISKPDERCCDQAPFFRARLEATVGPREVLASTEVCARHLGDAVQGLTVWAQEVGMQGEVTVLAIGGSEPCSEAGGADDLVGQMPSSFAFGIITIAPLAPGSPPGLRQTPAVRPAPSAYDWPAVGRRSTGLRLPASNSPAWLGARAWVA
jgi:hypothetical protein